FLPLALPENCKNDNRCGIDPGHTINGLPTSIGGPRRLKRLEIGALPQTNPRQAVCLTCHLSSVGVLVPRHLTAACIKRLMEILSLFSPTLLFCARRISALCQVRWSPREADPGPQEIFQTSSFGTAITRMSLMAML